jgi:hypothetical protein
MSEKAASRKAAVLALALCGVALLVWRTSAMALTHSPVGGVIFFVACLPIVVLGSVLRPLGLPEAMIVCLAALGQFAYFYGIVRFVRAWFQSRKSLP